MAVPGDVIENFSENSCMTRLGMHTDYIPSRDLA